MWVSGITFIRYGSEITFIYAPDECYSGDILGECYSRYAPDECYSGNAW
jgi:hypothetical protein